MKKQLIKILRFLKYPKCHNNEAFVKYLKKHNVKVGKFTQFYSPESIKIDVVNGMFITIGDYCKITSGVRILAHDYSYSVLRRVYHDIPKKAAMTVIGNNVFIGVDSIILNGAQIGDNVIIGAGSVVSGVVPSNQVWGGNPAKFICDLDKYYEKCRRNFEISAFLTVKQYRQRLHRNPTVEELQYFSLLFINNEKDLIHKLETMSFTGDDKSEVLADLKTYKPKYKSYNAFLDKVDEKF